MRGAGNKLLLGLLIEHCCDLLTNLIGFVEEDYDVGVKRLLEDVGPIDDLLNQSKQASFSVEPCVGANLLTEGIE